MRVIVLAVFFFAVVTFILINGFLMTFLPDRFLVFYGWWTQRSPFSRWQVEQMRLHPGQYRVVGIFFMLMCSYILYGLFQHLLRHYFFLNEYWSSKVDEFNKREHGLEKRDLTQLVTEQMLVERR